jgi:hypothetical protein
VWPNTSLKWSTNGMPPGLVRGCAHIFHSPGLAASRCCPLSSNVRRHKDLFMQRTSIRRIPPQVPKPTREQNVRLWLDVVKTGATVIGATMLFVLLQRPDSLLNRENTLESIARERAKLTLDVLKLEDPRLREQSLKAIGLAYGQQGQWVSQVSQLVESSTRLTAVISEMQRLNTQLIEANDRVANGARAVQEAARTGCPRGWTLCVGSETRRRQTELEDLQVQRARITSKMEELKSIQDVLAKIGNSPPVP